MSHLQEGVILALRDGAVEDDTAAAHLAECAVCLRTSEEVQSRSATIEQILSSLDDPADVVRARTEVLHRLGDERAKSPPGSPKGPFLAAIARRHLGRAAAVLLLTAAAVSALPWSPVARWWDRPERESAPGPDPVEASDPLGFRQAGRVTVALPENRIEVVVRGATAGATVEVAWVDGASARVSAPDGSRFSLGGGRAEVDAAAGPILVELPRTASFASLQVDGMVYLQGSVDRLDVGGPVTERTEARILFLVPSP